MSGTFPASPVMKGADIDSNQPTIVDLSESARRQSRTVEGHLWSARCMYPEMEKADFRPLFAFAAAQKGRSESFQIVFPHLEPLGAALGTPQVSGALLAGVTSVNLSNYTASIAGIIKAADFFKFNNHSKVYMFTEDADSSAGGAVTGAQFIPALIEDVPDLTQITIHSIPFTMAFKNDIQSYKTSSPLFMKYEIDLIEAIS